MINYTFDIKDIIIVVLVAAAGYYGYHFYKSPKAPDEVTTTIITHEDSIRIAKRTLIESAAIIQDYVIGPNGEWVKRSDKVKYVITSDVDTLIVPTNPDCNDCVSEDGVTIATTTVAIPFTWEDIEAGTKVEGEDVLHAEYHFPPKNKFKFTLDRDNTIIVRDSTKIIKEVFKEITADPAKRSFWQRFDYGPQIGLGIGLGDGKALFTPYIGFGVTYGLR